MARAPRKAKPAAQTPENKAATAGLLDAVKFIKQAQKEDGNDYETHCCIANKGMWAFDGTLAAGYPIPDELSARPHTGRLLDALKRVGAGLQITQSGEQLLVQSAKFRALVPCLDWATNPNVMPDMPVAPATDALRDAIAKVAALAVESAPQVLTASVKLADGYVSTTDRILLLEAWHGVSMPELVIPKTSAAVIAKQTLKLVSFGFSERTLTLWYENGAWLRTQLYSDPWPNTQPIWKEFDPTAMQPLPADFFEAVEAVASFGSGRVYFGKGMLLSHATPEGEPMKAGASYMTDVENDIAVSAKDIMLLKGHVNAADFADPICYLIGENFRAALTTFTDQKA